MKLHEVTNDIDVRAPHWTAQPGHTPHRTSRALDSTIKKAAKSSSHTPLGIGSFAYVYADDVPDKQDEVTRLSSSAQDSTTLYLNAVYNAKSLRANPYLPRVKASSTANGVQTFVMERLVPFTADAMRSPLLLEATARRMFTDKAVNESMVSTEMVNVIPQLLSKVLVYDKFDIVADPQLHEALTLIQEVSDQDDRIVTDIHYNNIMWRITGTAPQLVITDPLAVV